MDQVVELQPPQRGRVRKPWTVVAVQDVPGEQSLREAGQEWLKRNGHIHKTLTNSSSSGRVTLIARCNECLECSKQFCFGWTSDNKLQVETTGEHSEKKNEKVMKRHYAKSYGEKNTPCRALKAMRQGGVPTDLRPSTGQLKHARRQLQLDGRVDGYSVECLGEVQEFISNPPADVRVLEEHVICSSERVILPFCLKNMDEVDRIWRETEMSSFLLDYTFQTNKEGLLLGAVGPVGLTVSSRGPSMRFLPVLFMLASSEDSDAQKRLLFLFLEKSHDLGIPLSDAFLDCSCFHAVAAACREEHLGLNLHRCLEHAPCTNSDRCMFCVVAASVA